MEMTYTQIKMSNKSYKVILSLPHDCKIHFTDTFSSISNTYTGLSCDSYTNSIRGLLRTIPNFFEMINEHSYEKDLKEMGFKEVDPTETEILIYK